MRQDCENEQSPELCEIMYTFPHGLVRWGWLSILIIVMLLAIGLFGVQYPQTIIYPVIFDRVTVPNDSVYISCETVNPAPELIGIQLGETITVQLPDMSSAPERHNVKGRLSAIVSFHSNRQFITIQIPFSPFLTNISGETGVIAITNRHQRLIDMVHF